MLHLIKAKWLVSLSFLLGIALVWLDGYFVFPAIRDYLRMVGAVGWLSGLGGLVFAYVLILWSFLFIVAPFNKNSKILGVIAIILFTPAGLIIRGIKKVSGVIAKIIASVITLIFSMGAALFLYLLISVFMPIALEYNAPYYYLFSIVGSYTFVSIGRWINNRAHEFFLDDKLAEDQKMTFDQASFWVAVVSFVAFLITSFIGVCFDFSGDNKTALDAIKDSSGVFAAVSTLISLGRLAYGKAKKQKAEEISEDLKMELYADFKMRFLDEIKASSQDGQMEQFVSVTNKIQNGAKQKNKHRKGKKNR